MITIRMGWILEKNKWVYFMKNANNLPTDAEIRRNDIFQNNLYKLYCMSFSSKVRKEYEEGQRDSLELWSFAEDATVDGFKKSTEAWKKKVEKAEQKRKEAEAELAQWQKETEQAKNKAKEAEVKLAKVERETERVIHQPIIAMHRNGTPMNEIARIFGHSIDYVEGVLLYEMEMESKYKW